MLLLWDIIVDILSRLPTKSLLRFRCVSKKFLSLIDSKDFIYLHVNRSIENNSNLNLIISLSMWMSESRVYSLSLDSLDSCVEIARRFRKCMFHVMGSCNGLLALQSYSKGIVLLNPFTKEHLELPEFYDDELWCEALFDGFGYDVSSDDYKLVRIAGFNEPDKQAEVTVYSLKNNSSKKIKDFPYKFWLNRGFGAFVHGALHWLAHLVLNPECFRDDLMIAFDLKSEEFYQVPMPLTDGNGARFMGVDVLGGCLSLACTYDTDMVWDIFVMKEYGVKESWTKLFTLVEEVIDSCDYVKALAYSRSGYKVLIVDSNGKLYWYDLEKQRVESGIEIDVPGIADCVNGIVCVDGLVSLDAYVGNG